MSDVIHLDNLSWEPLRTDVARGVFARTYFNKEGLKISYVRVEPGGRFESHRDAYGHLLHFLTGSGVAGFNGKEFPVGPGIVVQVIAGDEHFYLNTGDTDLILISMNMLQ
jgi:quercetin dioxygenase-like cupin family protein